MNAATLDGYETFFYYTAQCCGVAGLAAAFYLAVSVVYWALKPHWPRIQFFLYVVCVEIVLFFWFITGQGREEE